MLRKNIRERVSLEDVVVAVLEANVSQGDNNVEMDRGNVENDD